MKDTTLRPFTLNSGREVCCLLIHGVTKVFMRVCVHEFKIKNMGKYYGKQAVEQRNNTMEKILCTKRKKKRM